MSKLKFHNDFLPKGDVPHLSFRAMLLLGVLIVMCLVAFSCQAQEVSIPAIIFIESSGNPQAYNEKSGCIGLMGINPKASLIDYNTHFKVNIEPDHLYFGDVNVTIGTWYINEKIPAYLKAYDIPDTVNHRIIAYNFGIGNLKKWYRAGANYKMLPKETFKYLEKYSRFIAK